MNAPIFFVLPFRLLLTAVRTLDSHGFLAASKLLAWVGCELAALGVLIVRARHHALDWAYFGDITPRSRRPTTRSVNYIEHYGLVRSSQGSGREPIGPAHSWDTSRTITNWALFNLGRHADHHMHARRPYQDLRPTADSPEMPLGYMGMIMMAAVPPLWFRVMDRRLDRYREHADLTTV